MGSVFSDAAELKHYYFNEQQLPLVIEPVGEMQAVFSYLKQQLIENNALFKQDLLTHGGILFRGFQVDNLEKFSEIISSCSLGLPYKYEFCPARRVDLRAGITESLNVDLPIHNEKSYALDFPNHIYFNCLHAPEAGGETPIANGRKIWLSLPEYLQNKLIKKGIMYRHHYYGLDGIYKFLQWIHPVTESMSWSNRFETKDRKRVERILKDRGEQIKPAFGDGILAKQILPACRMHPEKNELVWFNFSNIWNPHYNYYSSLIKSLVPNKLRRLILLNQFIHPNLVCFGDGEPMSKEDAGNIHQAIESNTILFPWKVGDVLILDNYSCLHGKSPHTGHRSVLVCLTNNPKLKAKEHG